MLLPLPFPPRSAHSGFDRSVLLGSALSRRVVRKYFHPSIFFFSSFLLLLLIHIPPIHPSHPISLTIQRNPYTDFAVSPGARIRAFQLPTLECYLQYLFYTTNHCTDYIVRITNRDYRRPASLHFLFLFFPLHLYSPLLSHSHHVANSDPISVSVPVLPFSRPQPNHHLLRQVFSWYVESFQANLSCVFLDDRNARWPACSRLATGRVSKWTVSEIATPLSSRHPC